ncbi:hypothetical protein OG589_19110 [Sphaerisporangium sp. NBC_01403]|uniref:hypothetical protein n=1 Tax=Sphaerisporangium sp. NBC_01403 TaxID=2903599 RepID=UPI003244B183
MRRVWGTWREPYYKSDNSKVYVVDARLTGWGARIVITPPPADEVITPDELAAGRYEAPVLPEPSIG